MKGLSNEPRVSSVSSAWSNSRIALSKVMSVGAAQGTRGAYWRWTLRDRQDQAWSDKARISLIT
jgi:hypothetical protein